MPIGSNYDPQYEPSKQEKEIAERQSAKMKRYKLTFEYLEPMELHFPDVPAETKDTAIDLIKEMLSHLEPQPEGLRMTECEEIQVPVTTESMDGPPITLFGKGEK